MVYYLFIGTISLIWLLFVLLSLFMKRQFSLELQEKEYSVELRDFDLVVYLLDTYCTPNAKAAVSVGGKPLKIELEPKGDRFYISLILHTRYLNSRRGKLLEIAAEHADFTADGASGDQNQLPFYTSRDHPQLYRSVSEFVRCLLRVSASRSAKVVFLERQMVHRLFQAFVNYRHTKDAHWTPGKPRLNREERSKKVRSGSAKGLLFFVVIAPILYLAAYVGGGMNAVLMTTLAILSVHIVVLWRRKSDLIGLYLIGLLVVLVLAFAMGSDGLRFIPTIVVLQTAAFIYREHRLDRGLFSSSSPLKNLSKSRRNLVAVATFALALGLSEWMRISQPDHVWIVYFAFFRLEMLVMLTSVFLTASFISDETKATRN
ncbi:MAG: hypothetical protein GY796_25720 [Chloroflexi bacterium]|nr:hypothetical protein [Chloroflexota bacterium]